MPFRYSPQLPSGMCAAAPHHPNPASPPIPPLPRLTAPSVFCDMTHVLSHHVHRRHRLSPLSTDPLPCSHPALSVYGKHTTGR